jgi:hypothetical protein
MFLIRGLVFTHEAVRDWEAKLAPRLAEGLRKRRVGKAGRCWPCLATGLRPEPRCRQDHFDPRSPARRPG